MTDDTREQIHKCLNCSYAFCVNCVDRDEYKEAPPFEWNRRLTDAQREYLGWYYMGYTDYEIAAKLDLHENTIMSRRIALGLPPLPHNINRKMRKVFARKILGGRSR